MISGVTLAAGRAFPLAGSDFLVPKRSKAGTVALFEVEALDMQEISRLRLAMMRCSSPPGHAFALGAAAFVEIDTLDIVEGGADSSSGL